MKKILSILILVMLLITSCVNPHKVIGDDYVVKKVELCPSRYDTKYHIIARPTNKNAGYGTFRGNIMDYYTNTFYSVGDTIVLVNSKIE